MRCAILSSMTSCLEALVQTSSGYCVNKRTMVRSEVMPRGVRPIVMREGHEQLEQLGTPGEDSSSQRQSYWLISSLMGMMDAPITTVTSSTAIHAMKGCSQSSPRDWVAIKM
jgi:hypothetical protein